MTASTFPGSPSDCAHYDGWVWAQTVYEASPAELSCLDSDGDGIACPNLPVYGFAHVLWTDWIPDGVRIYHIDASETSSKQHCGDVEATAFLHFIPQWAPNSTVYLQHDQTERDRLNRRLANAYHELAGDDHMVNEAMVRTGCLP